MVTLNAKLEVRLTGGSKKIVDVWVEKLKVNQVLSISLLIKHV